MSERQQLLELAQDFKNWNKTNSLLISFEGIEGSGKTTQIQMLAKYFESKGRQVTCLREPGGTTFGEQLRSAILDSNEKIHPLAEAHLFASSRAQLLSQKIIPLLEKRDQIIILDRYIDSSLAYQGMARKLGAHTVLKIHSDYPLNLFPNLTFYLKIDLQTSMVRQQKRNNIKDYFEKEDSSFYQDLINGFELGAQLFPRRVSVIDASQDVENVHQQIIDKLDL